ncbi:MBL fold metallo-hydrolase [Hyphobacterium sp. SN044]|uniref:MBL fold metallo-hydrolase n=1 Tax=Hyphobacterium sp. SN044 TaxID=2912575 RepID=UPI001F1EE977|nr:MBL fold metallo-hydrolase [Hyphobacterium sp. SN044]MCF8880675.1 MBL fold metallo-hydrolase [Hyphobacterium sp. SN044]
MTGTVEVKGFFNEPTFTVSYVVWDRATLQAAIVDPVLDYDPKSGAAGRKSLDLLLDFVRKNNLQVKWSLETHAHADHLSAAPLVVESTGAKIVIGDHIPSVQAVFKPVFAADDVSGTGAEFDRLVTDGETLELGRLEIEILHTPGHTPACVSYRIGDAVFVGDTLFMPDYGTARCDFPGGDARALYRSIHKILSLPRETRLFMCHDYKAPGRDTFAWETTVGEELDHNIHIGGGVSEDDFARMRTARDSTLAAPTLLLPSIQTNIRAGHFPPADPDGAIRLRIPVRGADALTPMKTR